MVIIKLKEWITAVKLEYNYTKEEIIAMYLNKVFYGSNAYGIKAAANTFFGKEPSELTIPEAAMLVGVVNAPTRYNPVNNPDRSIVRRNTVMARMKSAGFISREQLDSLVQTPIMLNYNPVTHNDGIATYFREMIRNVMNMPRPHRSSFSRKWDYDQELRRWEENPLYGWCHKNTKDDGTPYNIYRDGLKIYTTLDYSMQQYAEAAVQRQLDSVVQPAMERQYRRTRTLFVKTSAEAAEQIVRNAMRNTDRYRNLKADGASNAEIEKDFRTPANMRIFTYKGDRDTLMTPRDSILHYKRIMRASFMAADPSNGHVKAYVGGPNFRYFKYDMVKQGKRQVGSTIKPFVYTFAMDYMGFTPCTMVPNLQTAIETYTGEPWSPKEASEVIYDGQLHPLRWGLSHSRNNYSAWIMKQAGQPKAVADFINKMGIHSYIDPVNALALGTADVSLFEMVGAYSTFANRGVFIEPIFVTRIEDRQGNLIASFTPSSSDAISEQTAYTMLQMLEDVVKEGTAGRLRWQYGFTNADIGGKTGTSQENRDAWFVGVTSKLVAGAWIGGEDQSVHIVNNGEGSALALPIFGDFMTRVYNNRSINVNRTDKFYRPEGAVEYNCPDTEDPLPDTGSTTGSDEFFD
jgi:penicillin-binding protein 1A